MLVEKVRNFCLYSETSGNLCNRYEKVGLISSGNCSLLWGDSQAIWPTTYRWSVRLCE